MKIKPEGPNIKGNEPQLIKEQVGEIRTFSTEPFSPFYIRTERIPLEERDEFNHSWSFLWKGNINVLEEVSRIYLLGNALLAKYGYKDPITFEGTKLYAWRYETQDEVDKRVTMEQERLAIYKQKLGEYRQYLIDELLTVERTMY
jgi:hypothetical protein